VAAVRGNTHRHQGDRIMLMRFDPFLELAERAGELLKRGW
jgi:hypothetical protein